MFLVLRANDERAATLREVGATLIANARPAHAAQFLKRETERRGG